MNNIQIPLASSFRILSNYGYSFTKSVHVIKPILTLALIIFSVFSISYCLIRSGMKNYRVTRFSFPKTFTFNDSIEKTKDFALALEKNNNAHSITQQPKSILTLILSMLSLQSWHLALKVSKQFYQVSKEPIIISHLLQSEGIPSTKFLELVQLAKSTVKKLFVNKYDITDQELQKLFALCPNIQILNVSLCPHLTDAAFRDLPPNLHTLYFPRDQYLTREAFSYLPSTLTHIQINAPDLFFTLNQNENLDEPTIHKICSIPTLQHLTLTGSSNILKKSIDQLSTTLLSLNISFSMNLTDGSLDHLPKTLTYLNLSHCEKLQQPSFRYLIRLKHLSLNYCKNITNTAVENAPPHVEVLEVTGCKKLTNSVLSKLRDSITSLNLARCDGITAEGLVDIPQGIEILTLFAVKNLTDAVLSQFFESHQSLKKLSLIACDEITDAIIPLLPHSLTDFTMNNCKRITGATLGSLHKHVETLSLNGCKALTDDSLRNLKDHPGIRHLNLNYSYVSDEMIHDLPPNLLSLHLATKKSHPHLAPTSRFTGSTLHALPNKLQMLNLSKQNFGFDKNKLPFIHLPETLMDLKVSYCGLTKEAYHSLKQLREMRESLRIHRFNTIQVYR